MAKQYLKPLKLEGDSFSVEYLFYIRKLPVREKGLLKALEKFYQKYAWDLVDTLRAMIAKLLKRDEDWQSLFKFREKSKHQASAFWIVMRSEKPLTAEEFSQADSNLFSRVKYLCDYYEYEDKVDSAKRSKIKKIIDRLKRRVKLKLKEGQYKTKLINACLFSKVSLHGELVVNGEPVGDRSFSTLPFLKDATLREVLKSEGFGGGEE